MVRSCGKMCRRNRTAILFVKREYEDGAEVYAQGETMLSLNVLGQTYSICIPRKSSR
jgi:hypothetical protein